MELIGALVRARQCTALVATHDPALLDLADRVLTLRDGQLAEPAATPAVAPASSPAPLDQPGVAGR
jgi:putative ABC transport system ATP-binding protein